MDTISFYYKPLKVWSKWVLFACPKFFQSKFISSWCLYCTDIFFTKLRNKFVILRWHYLKMWENKIELGKKIKSATKQDVTVYQNFSINRLWGGWITFWYDFPFKFSTFVSKHMSSDLLFIYLSWCHKGCGGFILNCI